jgi:hypothetical protein
MFSLYVIKEEYQIQLNPWTDSSRKASNGTGERGAETLVSWDVVVSRVRDQQDFPFYSPTDSGGGRHPPAIVP